MTQDGLTTNETENLVLSVVLAHNVAGVPLKCRDDVANEALKLQEWVETARFNGALADLLASGRCCARVVDGDLGDIYITEQAKRIVAELRPSKGQE